MNNEPTIGQWLESIQLGQYAATFAENGITFDVLRELTDDDLKVCGVTILGHRKLILQKIRDLSPASAPAAAPHEATVPAQPVAATPAPAFPAETPRHAAPAVIPAGTGKESAAPRRNRLQRLASSKVFVFSVILHILFGIGAAYFIVQRIQAKRVITFQGGPPSPNPSTRALEHKMNMTRVKQTMSAPAQAKHITTTGLSKVSLPDMPSMPDATEIVPNKMAGMGGAGVGFGPGGMSAGTDTGSGGGTVPLFGFNQPGGGSLTGTFYDLKQEKGGTPTKMAGDSVPGGSEDEANKLYADEVTKFCASGWNDNTFAKYFKGPRPLYATQIFIPRITSEEGPKEFRLEDRVKPKRWVVHYTGKVIPPESGRYRFVGFGDDVLVVKFNGRVVLDSGFLTPEGTQPKSYYMYDGLSPSKDTGEYAGCGVGEYFEVTAGSTYNIDILIGEWPGGYGKAWVLLQKEGAEYEKDSKGNPKLPIFKLAKSGPPKKGGEAPVIGNDTSWSIWKGVAPSTTPTSALDMLKSQ